MAKPPPMDRMSEEDADDAQETAASTKLPGVIAPDSVMSAETRQVLGVANELDQKIAGTGGIQTITADRMQTGELRVTISGTVQESIGSDAPRFNSSSKLLRADEVGLSGDEWERAHMWGPGFGDEAAAGIWYASEEVNQLLQNRVSEDFIRDLASQAAERGQTVNLEVTAERWSASDLPDAHRGGDFLKSISYKINVEGPDSPGDMRIEFSLNPPPDGSLEGFDCDDQSRPVIEAYVDELRPRG